MALMGWSRGTTEAMLGSNCSLEGGGKARLCSREKLSALCCWPSGAVDARVCNSQGTLVTHEQKCGK